MRVKEGDKECFSSTLPQVAELLVASSWTAKFVMVKGQRNRERGREGEKMPIRVLSNNGD